MSNQKVKLTVMTNMAFVNANIAMLGTMPGIQMEIIEEAKHKIGGRQPKAMKTATTVTKAGGATLRSVLLKAVENATGPFKREYLFKKAAAKNFTNVASIKWYIGKMVKDKVIKRTAKGEYEAR